MLLLSLRRNTKTDFLRCVDCRGFVGGLVRRVSLRVLVHVRLLFCLGCLLRAWLLNSYLAPVGGGGGGGRAGGALDDAVVLFAMGAELAVFGQLGVPVGFSVGLNLKTFGLLGCLLVVFLRWVLRCLVVLDGGLVDLVGLAFVRVSARCLRRVCVLFSLLFLFCCNGNFVKSLSRESRAGIMGLSVLLRDAFVVCWVLAMFTFAGWWTAYALLGSTGSGNGVYGGLLQQGMSKPRFCGALVCRVRKKIGKISERFRKLINRYRRFGYSLEVARWAACLVVGPIVVGGCASLFSCTMAVRASDSMTASWVGA